MKKIILTFLFILFSKVAFAEELNLKCEVEKNSLGGTSMVEDVRFFGKNFIIRTDKKNFVMNPGNEVNILHGLSSIKQSINTTKPNQDIFPYTFIFSYNSIEEVKSRKEYEKLFYKYKGTLNFTETTIGKEYYLLVNIVSYNGDPKEYEKNIIRSSDRSFEGIKRNRNRNNINQNVSRLNSFNFNFPCKKI